MLLPQKIILQADQVSKRFNGNTVIKDLSIAFQAQMLHTILGPNGAGKTTLFNLLTRDLPLNGGDILLRGKSIKHMKPHQIARNGVGRSYQISSVFPDLTFLENVWLGAYRKERNGKAGFFRTVRSYSHIRDEAYALLESLGLAPFAELTAKETSYGDQRLLEIAVTLATSPEILLLDEPTAGLSQKETERIKHFILGIKPHYTIIMIEHKMNVVMEISDRIHVMNRGALIASGSPDEISRNETVRQAYFGM
jgi:branched-chain amino acid transport system ATP-binding protein